MKGRLILALGIALLLPGILALATALWQGPGSWALSQKAFWGTPIANFVFWIGLAHAGTFFSAVLLVLGARFGRRVALIAEISTIASLFVAATYPLVHMGIPQRFYAMIPLGNSRHFYVNAESPLVWDFAAIFVYAAMSTLYLGVHLLSAKNPAIEKFRKPFAWILFPLVLWVHTIVSMDFAVTFVPEWRGGYFPMFFIFGALYSGVSLVVILLEALGKRVRRVEDLLLCFSWAMLAFWIWEAVFKGVWHGEVLTFGFLVVQLLWLPKVRENAAARVAVSLSALFALWMERLELVSPASPEWTWVDFGFAAFGIGFFIVAFNALFFSLKRFFPKAFGDLAGESSMREVPFAAKPFAVSAVCGVLAAGTFAVYFVRNAPEFPTMRLLPILFPLAALTCGIALFFLMACELWGKRRTVSFAGVALFLLCALGGGVFRGTDVDYVEAFPEIRDEKSFDAASGDFAGELWSARCAACHGKSGEFNRKFVHAYYPLPQKLSLSRIDTIGADSLAKVILQGRGYMRPFSGRVSEDEARKLAEYLKLLATRKESALP